MGFDANISIHDLADTYFVGMRMAAEANISSAMCAVSACTDAHHDHTIM